MPDIDDLRTVAGRIVPNRSLAAMSAGGAIAGGTYVALDLRGAQVYDGSRFEDLIVRALDRAQRGGRIVKVTR